MRQAMQPAARIAILAIAAVIAFGQPGEPERRFVAADVHISATGPARVMTGGFVANGRYELRHATLVDLIRTAYSVDAGKVTGGPAWLATDRFDVIAQAPANSTPDDLKPMLKALLADRFGLAARADTKPMPAFALTAGTKPKLKPAHASGEGACALSNPPGAHGTFSNLAECRNITMAGFAEWLQPIAARSYLNGLPLVDQTGLKGDWDFSFSWYSQLSITLGGAENITFTDALDKQLGLKLELTKVPQFVVVVDRINQKPADNPPGTVEILSARAAPTAFEVAEVKLSNPDDTSRMLEQMLPGGRLNIRNMPLGFLVKHAWHIHSDDLIAGAPKWFETDRFDIVAKTTTVTPVDGQLMDSDAIYPMIQLLLADRFKLATHFEDRPVTAYTLVAAKPKLTKADASTLSECRRGVGRDGKDPRRINPDLTEILSCQNITMAQFSAQLQALVPGYITKPVSDSTGISGTWDFTVAFNLPIVGNRGGVTLPDALQQQLGLKLADQKRPMPVLVIDHVERLPTNN
jgi:uncharacterized protein (TIGR03435 family)